MYPPLKSQLLPRPVADISFEYVADGVCQDVVGCIVVTGADGTVSRRSGGADSPIPNPADVA